MTTGADSNYTAKLAELRQYIPFLETMIHKLEKADNQIAQCNKIKSLHSLIVKGSRMKMENLLKCEEILLNMYRKVHKKEPDALQLQNLDKNTKQSPTVPSHSTRDKEEKASVSPFNSVIKEPSKAIPKSPTVKVENSPTTSTPTKVLSLVSRADTQTTAYSPVSKTTPVKQSEHNKSDVTESDTKNHFVNEQPKPMNFYKETSSKDGDDKGSDLDNSRAKLNSICENLSPSEAKPRREYTRVLKSPEAEVGIVKFKVGSPMQKVYPKKITEDVLFYRRSPKLKKKKDCKSSPKLSKSQRRAMKASVFTRLGSKISKGGVDYSEKLSKIINSYKGLDHLTTIRDKIVKELLVEEVCDMALSTTPSESKSTSIGSSEQEDGEIMDSDDDTDLIYNNLLGDTETSHARKLPSKKTQDLSRQVFQELIKIQMLATEKKETPKTDPNASRNSQSKSDIVGLLDSILSSVNKKLNGEESTRDGATSSAVVQTVPIDDKKPVEEETVQEKLMLEKPSTSQSAMAMDPAQHIMRLASTVANSEKPKLEPVKPKPLNFEEDILSALNKETQGLELDKTNKKNLLSGDKQAEARNRDSITSDGVRRISLEKYKESTSAISRGLTLKELQRFNIKVSGDDSPLKGLTKIYPAIPQTPIPLLTPPEEMNAPRDAVTSMALPDVARSPRPMQNVSASPAGPPSLLSLPFKTFKQNIFPNVHPMGLPVPIMSPPINVQTQQMTCNQNQFMNPNFNQHNNNIPFGHGGQSIRTPEPSFDMPQFNSCPSPFISHDNEIMSPIYNQNSTPFARSTSVVRGCEIEQNIGPFSRSSSVIRNCEVDHNMRQFPRSGSVIRGSEADYNIRTFVRSGSIAPSDVDHSMRPFSRSGSIAPGSDVDHNMRNFSRSGSIARSSEVDHNIITFSRSGSVAPGSEADHNIRNFSRSDSIAPGSEVDHNMRNFSRSGSIARGSEVDHNMRIFSRGGSVAPGSEIDHNMRNFSRSGSVAPGSEVDHNMRTFSRSGSIAPVSEADHNIRQFSRGGSMMRGSEVDQNMRQFIRSGSVMQGREVEPNYRPVSRNEFMRNGGMIPSRDMDQRVFSPEQQFYNDDIMVMRHNNFQIQESSPMQYMPSEDNLRNFNVYSNLHQRESSVGRTMPTRRVLERSKSVGRTFERAKSVGHSFESTIDRYELDGRNLFCRNLERAPSISRLSNVDDRSRRAPSLGRLSSREDRWRQQSKLQQGSNIWAEESTLRRNSTNEPNFRRAQSVGRMTSSKKSEEGVRNSDPRRQCKESDRSIYNRDSRTNDYKGHSSRDPRLRRCETPVKTNKKKQSHSKERIIDLTKSYDKERSTDRSKSSDKDHSTGRIKLFDKECNTSRTKTCDKERSFHRKKSSNMQHSTDRAKSSDKERSTDRSKSSDKHSSRHQKNHRDSMINYSKSQIAKSIEKNKSGIGNFKIPKLKKNETEEKEIEKEERSVKDHGWIKIDEYKNSSESDEDVIKRPTKKQNRKTKVNNKMGRSSTVERESVVGKTKDAQRRRSKSRDTNISDRKSSRLKVKKDEMTLGSRGEKLGSGSSKKCNQRPKTRSETLEERSIVGKDSITDKNKSEEYSQLSDDEIIDVEAVEDKAEKQEINDSSDNQQNIDKECLETSNKICSKSVDLIPDTEETNIVIPKKDDMRIENVVTEEKSIRKVDNKPTMEISNEKPLEKTLQEKEVSTGVDKSEQEKEVSTNITKSVQEKEVCTNITKPVQQKEVSTEILKSEPEKVVSTDIAKSELEKEVSTEITKSEQEKEVSTAVAKSEQEEEVSTAIAKSESEREVSAVVAKSVQEKGVDAMSIESKSEIKSETVTGKFNPAIKDTPSKSNTDIAKDSNDKNEAEAISPVSMNEKEVETSQIVQDEVKLVAIQNRESVIETKTEIHKPETSKDNQKKDDVTNLLSLLNDKSKLMEMLNLLTQTEESEKIRKKLQKLAESDDENDQNIVVSSSDSKAVEDLEPSESNEIETEANKALETNDEPIVVPKRKRKKYVLTGRKVGRPKVTLEPTADKKRKLRRRFKDIPTVERDQIKTRSSRIAELSAKEAVPVAEITAEPALEPVIQPVAEVAAETAAEIPSITMMTTEELITKTVVETAIETAKEAVMEATVETAVEATVDTAAEAALVTVAHAAVETSAEATVESAWEPITQPTVQPTTKHAKRMNRELLALQEDIRDNISEDVRNLNPTGIRMCRAAKDSRLANFLANVDISEKKIDSPNEPTQKPEIDSSTVVEVKVAPVKKKRPYKRKMKNVNLPFNKLPCVILKKDEIFKNSWVTSKQKADCYDFDSDNSEELLAVRYPKRGAGRRQPSPEVLFPVIENDSEDDLLVSIKPGPKSKKKLLLAKSKIAAAEPKKQNNVNPTPAPEVQTSEDESLLSYASATSTQSKKQIKKKKKKKNWSIGIIKKSKKKTKSLDFDDLYDADRTNDIMPNLFTDKLYHFEEDKSVYNCKFCGFVGEDILKHHKQAHPHSEFTLARFDPVTASDAISQSREILTNNFINQCKKGNAKTSFKCRFCKRDFDNTTIKRFYEHVIRDHTGEYETQCSICSDGDGCQYSSKLFYPTLPDASNLLLLGYICLFCNYTQIHVDNVNAHIENKHTEKIEAIRVNLCMLPINETNSAAVISKFNKARSLSVTDSIQNKILQPLNEDHAMNSAANEECTEVLRPKSCAFAISTESAPEVVVVNIKKEPGVSSSSNDLETFNERKLAKGFPIHVADLRVRIKDDDSIEYSCFVRDCSKSFNKITDYAEHLKSIHSTDVWNGLCSECRRNIGGSKQLSYYCALRHIVSVHMENNSELMAELDAEKIEPSVKPLIQLRPMSDLLSKPTESSDNNDYGIRIENVISLSSVDETPLVIEPESVADKKLKAVKSSTARASPVPAVCEDDDLANKEAIGGIHKEPHLLSALLESHKLAHLFVCASTGCAYSTNSGERFVQHVRNHASLTAEDKYYSCCIYCGYANKRGQALMSHILMEHGSCRYLCKLCVFRAAAPVQVKYHMDMKHKSEESVIMSIPMHPQAKQITTSTYNVAEYICNQGNCQKGFVTRNHFMDHLNHEHAKSPAYSCHICNTMCLRPVFLINHYKNHMYCVYQCVYCEFGSETEGEITQHLMEKHTWKTPQACIRHLIKSGAKLDERGIPVIRLDKSEHYNVVGFAASGEADSTREDDPFQSVIDQSLRALPVPFSSEGVGGAPFADGAGRILEIRPVAADGDVTSVATVAQLISGSAEVEVTKASPKKVPSPRTAKLKTVTRTEALASGASLVKIAPKPEPWSPAPAPPPAYSSLTLAPLALADGGPGGSVINLDSDDEASPRKKPAEAVEVISVSDDEAEAPAVDLLVAMESVPFAPREPQIDPPTRQLRGPDLYKCGNRDCGSSSATLVEFKNHVFNCKSIEGTFCFHCKKSFKNTFGLFMHLPMHGVDRWRCGLCDFKKERKASVISHLKGTHKSTNYDIVPLDLSKLNENEDVFILKPIGAEPKNRIPKDVSPRFQLPKPPTSTKKTFTPTEIELLPMNLVWENELYCGLCSFSTKVRSNLVRHLMLHAVEIPVPSAAPVNPVPHLDTNEKHFDKMSNLALSSNLDRFNENVSIAEKSTVDIYPKYVAPKSRFVCGATGCTYISVDETMLKYHWEALHSSESNYKCCHCPPNQQMNNDRALTASRIVSHLKMHDSKLYNCPYCKYYHFHKHLIERHLVDKHPNLQKKISIIRELDENVESTSTEETRSAPTMDLKPWQCGLCSYKTMLKEDIMVHCDKTHNIKSQFKCSLCVFVTSSKQAIECHVESFHQNQTKEITIVYFKDDPQTSQSQDNHPLWWKQRKRPSQFMEENIPPSNELATLKKIKASDGPVPDQAKPKEPMKSSIVAKLNKLFESEKSLEREITIVSVKSEAVDVLEPEPEPVMEPERENAKKNTGQLKCTVCYALFGNLEDLREHLYEEFSYPRWSCSHCSIRLYSESEGQQHGNRVHHNINFKILQRAKNANKERLVDSMIKCISRAAEEPDARLLGMTFEEETIIPDQREMQSLELDEPSEDLTIHEAENLLEKHGPYGRPEGLKFTCPLCKYQTMYVLLMESHLCKEMMCMRWKCNRCEMKFCDDEIATDHCRRVHPLEQSGIEMLGDDDWKNGSIWRWIQSLLEVQRLLMPNADDAPTIRPASSLVAVELQPQKRPAEEKAAAPAPAKRSRNRTGLLACDSCPFTTWLKPTLAKHKTKHDNFEYSCQYCRYLGDAPTVVEAHCRTKHPGRPLAHVATDRRQLERLNASDVFCFLCQLIVVRSDVAAHIDDSHRGVAVHITNKNNILFGCTECGSALSDFVLVVRHFGEKHHHSKLHIAINKMDASGHPFKCEHCKKLFKYRFDLDLHRDVAHPEFYFNSTESLRNQTGDLAPSAATGKSAACITSPDWSGEINFYLLWGDASVEISDNIVDVTINCENLDS